MALGAFGALTLFCFANADQVAAQSRIGVRGGVTLASADAKDVEGTFDSKNRTGWMGGAFLTMGGGLITLQPEFNVIEIGFEAEGLDDEHEVKLRYLSPAAVLKIGIPLPVIRPSVFGGLAWNIQTTCRIDGTDCAELPMALETKSSDPSAIFGADVDFAFGSGVGLRADVRYSMGLSDITKASDVWTEIKNRAWQVSIGLSFPF